MRSSKQIVITILIILSIITLLTGCSKPTPGLPETSTSTIPVSTFPKSTSTTVWVSPTPTQTPTLLPTAEIDDREEAGLIIFSMGDGAYKHLFAYHPSYFPVTRITSDPWDFDYPSISPDGSKIAYCANQYGHWDVFILDLKTGLVNRITKTDTYACSPSWAPDGQWLAMEVFEDGKLDILIHPVDDLSITPIQLTENSGNNFSPSWSPRGREVAFISDRNGRNEVWIARLDTTQDRFAIMASSENADYFSPAWSPNGDMIAWSKRTTEETIEVWNMIEDKSEVIAVGLGSQPVWTPNGSGVLGIFSLPNQYNLVAYGATNGSLLLPPIPFSTRIFHYDWKANQAFSNIENYLKKVQQDGPPELWKTKITVSNPNTGRYALVKIENVEEPEAYLSDAVNESFEKMRDGLTSELGWDFLGTLENAALPLTTSPQAGIPENWLYTGRAIAVNQVPLQAGWMAVTREDFNGKSYWRVWLKCYAQDGTCGVPVKERIWDFASRTSGELSAYENGGKVNGTLKGYWFDFTEFASRYGWERLPAKTNWRSYYPGTMLNVFVLSQSLSWEQALLELYPAEAVAELISKNK